MASSLKRPDRDPDFVVKHPYRSSIERFWVKESLTEYGNYVDGIWEGSMFETRFEPTIGWRGNGFNYWESFDIEEIIENAYKKWLISKTLKEKLNE